LKKEKHLLKLLKKDSSSEKAFKLLLELYQEQLYWHIRKIVLIHEDSNDILQNTFIKAFKYLGNFKGNSSIKTWMYRIAYNESIDYLNNKKKHLQISSQELNNKILQDLQEDIYFEGDAIELLLQKALLSLPNKQRTVFRMRYYDDLKFKEIAEVLKTSEGSLKASYHIAAKKIAAFVTNDPNLLT